jgi:uncharacterized protein YjbI with pentapeptide repeats
VTFTGPVDLKNARFTRGFSFAGATFLKSMKFSKVWNDQVSGSKAEFAGATFFGSVYVRDKSAFYRANFKGADFKSIVTFKGQRFYSSACFDGARFRSAANFAKATFNGAAEFRKAEFFSEADFEHAMFRYQLSHARFSEAIFNAPAFFNSVLFSGNADFEAAEFRNGATFEGSWFSLEQTDEQDDSKQSTNYGTADLFANFDGAVFLSAPGEAEVVSFKDAKFGDANLHRSVSFERTHFKPWYSEGKPRAVLVNFEKMACNGPVSFSEARFHECVAANFTHARFQEQVDFEDCTFSGDAIFQRAQMRSDVYLAAARFKQYPDFRQANLTLAPNLSEAQLPENGKQPGSQEDTLSRIRALRKIAGQADEKRTEADLLVRELKLGGGVASRFYGLIANYGQSWLRPTLWLFLFAFVIFPPLYLANIPYQCANLSFHPCVWSSLTVRTNQEHKQEGCRKMSALARTRIEEAHHDEETVSMNPAFNYEGLDEEVAQALLDLAHYGERHREHLTRYARSRANRFVWVKASGWR